MPEPFVLRPRHRAERAGESATVAEVDPAFGSLAEHVRDERVTDIFVNGADELYVDRGEGAEVTHGRCVLSGGVARTSSCALCAS